MKPARLRQWLATLLLGVLVLAVLPRELFHDCGEEEHMARPRGATLHAACAMCDVAFPAYNVEPAELRAPVHVMVGVQAVVLLAQVVGLPCEAPCPRGPPQA